MCGIAGEFSFEKRPAPNVDALLKMSSLMERRGPDDSGSWTDGQNCSLVFRRLSILDLSAAGHQPMLTIDGRYVIVFNGEVYNFRDLRQQLSQEGVAFRSSGDTEVVLNALATWGKKALARFNGMFALAFYDSREKKLLLARDHMGIKPLYYLRSSLGIVFGSQYDQLMAHSWSREHSVDLGALSLYLQFGYIPAPFGLLKGSSMMEPGAWLEISASGASRQGKYYEFPGTREPDLRGDEANEAVDAAVTNAVRRQLVSDVPVGTFLSGGIDSPLVTAKISTMQTGTIQAFTIGLKGEDGDESADASAYARAFGVEHHIRHYMDADALDMIDDVVASCSEPFADYSVFPTMLVSRLARDRVKVMLSGDGGDELFWGYYGRFASVLASAGDFTMPRWMRVARRVFSRYLGKGEVSRNTMFPTVGLWFQLKHTRTFSDHMRRMFPDLAERPDGFKMFDYAGSEPDPTAQWLRWNEIVGHLTMVLLKVDRASMYHSLEVRVPLLDREVVEIASRIDWRSCLDLKNKVGKLPLRRSLANHVTKQSSAKRGFTVPMGEWLRGPLKARFEETVLDRREFLGVPFNAAPAKDMFSKHVRRQGEHGYSLWVLLSLALWEEKHFRVRSV